MGGHRNIIGPLLALLFASRVFADGYVDNGSLRESYDPELLSSMTYELDRLGLSPALVAEKLCIALVDITDMRAPRVAEINGDTMMYAASLPKIAILLGAFVEIERGRLSLDSETREAMTRMIQISSNTDATYMLNRVGKSRVNDILQSDRFRLYDPLVNGGLWVGKPYAEGAAFERDPLHNLSHGATAMQTARFYYMLENGELVNSKLTREMKKILGNPGISHKFVRGLADRPGVKMYRKSGSWRHWHADSALVKAQGHKYILVALADDVHGGEWLAALAPKMHDLIVPARLAAKSYP
ncbi:MAG: serine hydrolase [Gammaproteobacteria bacterium]|nr:serine hydrolase [Gammaproteobacteria bacterium]